MIGRFDVLESLVFVKKKQHVDSTLVSQKQVYLGYGPFPVTVSTRIITFLVGNPYKPLFATVTGKGPHPRYTGIPYTLTF